MSSSVPIEEKYPQSMMLPPPVGICSMNLDQKVKLLSPLTGASDRCPVNRFSHLSFERVQLLQMLTFLQHFEGNLLHYHSFRIGD